MAEEQEKKKEGFLWTMVRENFQSIGVGILIALGIRKKPQEGDENKTEEKEIPSWLLYLFKGMFIGEILKEFNTIIESREENTRVTETQTAMEEFVIKIEKDPELDFIGFLLKFIDLRREYMERLRHPAPKDESGRFKCEPIIFRDPPIAFMNRILHEKDSGGNYYERQKEFAKSRGLLKEKSTLVYISEHKLLTLVILIIGYGCFDLVSSLMSWVF